MSNLERKDQKQTNEQQPILMVASSIAVDGVAAATLSSVLLRVQKAVEHSGRSSLRVVAVSKTKHVSVLRQVYDADHRTFDKNYIQELIEKAPQIANHLDRAVANLGRKPLKVLVQLNISGRFRRLRWVAPM
ncbi:hypothetical protein ACFE04_017718 [Oxalis oulophora]